MAKAKKQPNRKIVDKISSIIGNHLLAISLYESIDLALRLPSVFLIDGQSVWDIFEWSLQSAIRDIENHPRGILFQRLLEYGPYHADHPEVLMSDGATTLSDPECGSCVQFIYSHMVNRFKGELAELLALKPCIELIQDHKKDGRLPSDAKLYWSDTVQERRQATKGSKQSKRKWGGFTKGADGLIIEQYAKSKNKPGEDIGICGIIEVKSYRARKKILNQIDNHHKRLQGGVRLREEKYSSSHINISKRNLNKIMVMPSSWYVSREWHYEKTNGVSHMVFPEPARPPEETQIKEMAKRIWRIILAWSKEAIEQAAYEMTFWYMSQVGTRIYKNKKMPKGWENMTPEEAGYNAIKMMLYYMPLRYLTKRQTRLAIRLYNIYSFGYPLGVDNKEMLWPEDLSE